MPDLSRFCFSLRSFLSRFLPALSSVEDEEEATPVPAFLMKLNMADGPERRKG